MSSFYKKVRNKQTGYETTAFILDGFFGGNIDGYDVKGEKNIVRKAAFEQKFEIIEPVSEESHG